MGWEIFSNPWFWGIVAGLGVFGLSALLRNLFRGVPMVRNLLTRQNMVIIGLIGLVATTGILGQFGTGSLNRGSGDFKIADFQVSTSFAGNCTIAQDNNVDDLTHVRCTDAQATETAGDVEIGTGVITVKRIGDLKAASVPVSARTLKNYESENTPGDGTKYTIVEVTTLDELEVYLNGASSSSAATTSSAKESTSLPFDEGVDTAYLGVLIEVDEGGHDALAQYSYRDVVVQVGNKPYTFRIHRMD